MITIAILAAALLGGVIVAAVLFLRAGIAGEESDNSLLGEPATLAAVLTRRIVGLYVSEPLRATQHVRTLELTDADEGQRPAASAPHR